MIQFGNKKLSKDIAIFSTSAGVEGSCEQNCEGCYALKIEKIRAVVRNYRKRNLVLAKSELFQYLMIAQIVEKDVHRQLLILGKSTSCGCFQKAFHKVCNKNIAQSTCLQTSQKRYHISTCDGTVYF